MEIGLSILLIILVGVFIIVQSATRFLDRRYLIGILWLFAVMGVGLMTGGSLVFSNRHPVYLFLGVLSLVIAFMFGLLLILKLGLRDNWLRSPGRLLRTLTTLDIPYEKFSVRTPDNIDISGYHIRKLDNERPRDRVVILAHGGFRSKDILVKALMAVWLSDRFDVIAFDFRGHGESGGAWTGDGKTVADLKAVIDYARMQGYRKVGVYGRSMGGWTAVLEAVDYHDVQAIVIAGMPPGFFSEVPEFKGRITILKYWGASFLMRVLFGVRFKYFDNARSPILEIGNVAPVPLLILYNETDPGAGVIGIPGHWEKIPLNKRDITYRRITDIHFTAEQVYEAASEPKKLHILPGAAHVYSLETLRELLTEVENWFKRYLD